MKIVAAFSAIFSLAMANQWALYCGSSCSDGILINSGSDYGAASCTNLQATYPYCHLESDEPWYKAVLFESSDCEVGGSDIETTIWAGECTAAGTWKSYMLVLNL